MQPPARDVKPRLYSRTNNEVASLWSSSLSPLTEQLWWFAIAALHTMCSLYYAAFSWNYWRLKGTLLDNWLSFYRLGLGSQHYITISIVHGCFAAIHFCYLIWMIGWSIKKQQFVLAVYKATGRTTRLNLHVIDRCCLIFSNLGVNGPYFDVVLLLREILETALQTNQAYQMSLLLSRAYLNRIYVSLLVLNCWSITIVHHIFRTTANRRLWALVCDCILDLMTSVGIPSALLVVYASEFIVEPEGYASYKWYDEVWIVHVLSEFQILMVASWGDFAMRVIFALSVVTNMNNMKGLLSASRTCRTSLKSGKSKRGHGITSIVPLNPSLSDVKGAYKRQMLVRAESWFTQILFFLWGSLILVCSLYAESVPTFSQCKLQVRPWFSSKPSCAFLMLNCYESKHNGTKDAVEAEWSPFDPATITFVVVRHCESLEMPPKLTDFSGLRALKVYNSTILHWEENVAISQTYHPNLLMLFIVRTNMTNGELPPGLYRRELPHTLRDIEFCSTNLRELPGDLDRTWPSFATIYIESSHLSEIPPSLIKLAPYDLSLAENPISTIPASIIEVTKGYLHVGGTKVSELPEFVTEISPYFKIRLDNTNISFFWDWMDPIVLKADGGLTDAVPTILAPNSPYCSDLQRIYGGEQLNFSAPKRVGQSVLLSDASVDNWVTLKKAVACDEWPTTYYPIDFEDEYSGVKTI